MSNAVRQEEMFVEGEWTPSELKLLQPPDDTPTAQWCEKSIVVIKSARPGPWRNANNPPLVGILNASDRRGLFRNCRTLVICKGVQTGVTTAAHNIVFRRMDNSAHNALIVMETERKVKRTVNQRIQKALYASPRLSAQMSPNSDDITNYSITMRTGFCLNIGWSGSASSVSSDPCETVILDEIDKYDTPMNIEDAKDRITTYNRTGLIVILSTPGLENGPILAEIDACDTIMDFYAICPDCSEPQRMVFENFTWPGKGEVLRTAKEKRALANEIVRERSARYACRACGVLWDDHARDRAVRLALEHNYHGWKMREPIDRPASMGFHFPSWISPFKSLSDVVGRLLKAEASGRPGRLQGWYNNEAAEAFVPKPPERDFDAILALRDKRPAGLVPREAGFLFLIIDTQQRGFYYEVRAFGWGQALESWQVRFGFTESEADLEDILYNSEYRDEDGNLRQIDAGFIDSGGGTGRIPKHSRTAEVYDFCRRNPIVRPIKGRQTLSAPWRVTQIDYYPRSKRPIPGGIRLYNINVTYYKDFLVNKLAKDPDEPGAWHLCADATDDYAKQMISEYKDEKGFWQCPKGRANHFWDIGVYALAGADILQIKYLKPRTDEPETTEQEPIKPKKERPRRW